MDVNEALQKIFLQKVAFSRLYENNRDVSVKDFFTRQIDFLRKQNENSTVIIQETRRVLGDHVAEKLKSHLQKYSYAHTADHIGIINHPFFWNTKAAFSEALPGNEKTILCITLGGVSPTNSSLPRALSWHDAELNEKRAPFVSLKYRQRSIYGIPARNEVAWNAWLNKSSFPENLKTIFTSIISNPKLYEFDCITDQLTYINYYWWQAIFGDNENLLYFEAETIANTIITDKIRDDSSEIHKLLFDNKTRDSYIKAFDNVVGAHSLKNNSHGSEIFWLIDNVRQHRLPLRIVDNEFVASDGQKFVIEKRTIISMLKDKTLLPTMALCYCILMSELKLTLTGGFSQIDYLGDMKDAWNEVFPKNQITLPTDTFAGELSLLSVAKDDEYISATLADLVIRTGSVEERNNLRTQMTKYSTLKEAIEASAKDILHIVDASYSTKNLPARTVINARV